MLSTGSTDGRGIVGKVGDFGLSLKMDVNETHISQVFQGTLSHMAPGTLVLLEGCRDGGVQGWRGAGLDWCRAGRLQGSSQTFSSNAAMVCQLEDFARCCVM